MLKTRLKSQYFEIGVKGSFFDHRETSRFVKVTDLGVVHSRVK